jgi:hypothetical protein
MDFADFIMCHSIEKNKRPFVSSSTVAGDIVAKESGAIQPMEIT